MNKFKLKVTKFNKFRMKFNLKKNYKIVWLKNG